MTIFHLDVKHDSRHEFLFVVHPIPDGKYSHYNTVISPSRLLDEWCESSGVEVIPYSRIRIVVLPHVDRPFITREGLALHVPELNHALLFKLTWM